MARKFDREFKLEAIRMASEEGITAREVEQRLGLSVGIISRWKKQLKDNGSPKASWSPSIWTATGSRRKRRYTSNHRRAVHRLCGPGVGIE